MIELYDDKGRKLASGTIVPDGGKLKVSTLMMDAAPDITAITRAALADAERPQAAFHKPSSAVLTDADLDARERQRADRKAKLSDAWRDPSAVNALQSEKPAPTTPTGDAADRRDARLRDAWRGGN